MAAPANDAIEIINKSIMISKGNRLCDVGSNRKSIMILIMRAIITPIIVANTILFILSSVSMLNARGKKRERTKGIVKSLLWL